VPEAISEGLLIANDAIVALVTVERGDNIDIVVPRLATEVRKMCRDTRHRRVILLPFAHLSGDLADPDTSLTIIQRLADILCDLQPTRAHFGSDKKLLLDIYGHKGSVRFRQF